MAPPLVCLPTAIPLTVESVKAWGAADIYTDMPEWWPTATGLLTTLVIVTVGIRTAIDVRSETSSSFDLELLSTFGGGAMLLMILVVALMMSAGLADSATYEHAQLFDKYGTLIVWSFLMAGWLGVIAAAGGIYAGGLERYLKRFEKSADEPDALGTIIADPRR